MISIVIPVRNGGQYLSATLDSLLTQTYSDYECLLIDDHSTDTALSDYLPDDSRFRVIRCQGQGIVDALNTGIAAAQYPIIARMDADDIALPNRLEQQLRYLQDNPEVAVCGAKIEFFMDNQPVGQGFSVYQQWINQLTRHDEIVENLFVECPLPHPTFMLRAEVLQTLNGYQGHGWPEDYDLLLRAHLAGYRFGKPDTVLLHWRDHQSRLSRNDSRYKKGAFFAAKAHYFSQLPMCKKPILIWGAGKTGRLLHDQLAKHGVVMDGFLEVSQSLIGRERRNLPIFDAIHHDSSANLILIAVSKRGIRQQIIDHLRQLGRIPSRDFIAMA